MITICVGDVDLINVFVTISVVMALFLIVMIYSSETTQQSVNVQPPTITIISQQAIKSLVTMEQLLYSTPWQSVNKINISNTSEQMLLDIEDWMEDLVDSFEDDELPIIPIATKGGIEYIKFIKIGSQNAFVGVGIKFCVTKQLLDGYYTQLCKNRLLSNDVIGLIMKYCTVLKISAIYLDPDYIHRQHQLLTESQGNMNFMDISGFTPFVSNLKIIESPEDGSYINLEEGESLRIPSDWSDDELTTRSQRI